MVDPARTAPPASGVAALRRATHGSVRWISAGLAWISALATASLIVGVGGVIDAGGARGLQPWQLPTMLALILIAAVATGTAGWFAQRSSARTEAVLRQGVIGRSFAAGVTSRPSGAMLALATASTERAAQYRAAFLGPILGSLTTPLVVLAVMALAVDAATAGWLALLLVCVPLLIGGFQRLVSPVGTAYRRSQARLTAAFLEAVQALETLVLARAADRTAADLTRRGEEHRRGLMKMLAGNQLLILVVDAGFSLAVVTAAALMSTAKVASGELSLGQGVAIVLMSVLVTGPVDVVGQFFYIGIAGRAAERQLAEHLARAESVPGHVVPAGAAGTITLNGVSAAWPGGPTILTDLSFTVAAGERVALVGPSGIGKSSVAAILQAHLTPSAGSVSLDGLDVLASDPDLVRSRVAVVEQRTFLFHGTIADNLRIASPAASAQQMLDALELAGLAGDVAAMPLGLETPVGEHGSTLSGGQAQRLSIARAALSEAPILLLDEPTSQVDLAGEAAILAALDRLATGRTVLMIAHRPGAILAADRVVDLEAVLV